ncbi:MAG: hypothetical protein DI587_37190 [Variovorax paradoxus]|nr:MAG: hypothetical protein DI583_37190 [Variovorax paradoxus]PZQ00154.1 MAG: hypothetical protein DI587_37190 [Variovorax paradoxus]
MTLILKTAPAGAYRYIAYQSQYSLGVQALPGHRLVRASFAQVVPLAEGFARIRAHLQARGLPLASFAACELRSPKPFDSDGFRAFNAVYADTLQAWGIADGDDNPVARSNVCPLVDGPAEPGFHAFCYAMPEAATSAASFVVSGGAETRTVSRPGEHRIVAFGDTSAQGMLAKGEHTIAEIERRLQAFGLGWRDTSAIQVYTVHDFHPVVAAQMAQRGMLRNGLTWQLCRPPVVDVEFEIDCRGGIEEIVLGTP